MKKAVLVIAGGLLVGTGVVWTLQGIGYVRNSFMTGVTLWAVIGPVVAVLGVAVIGIGLRTGHRPRTR